MQDMQCLLCSAAVRVDMVVLLQFVRFPVWNRQHMTQMLGKAQKVPDPAAGFELGCITCHSREKRSTTW